MNSLQKAINRIPAATFTALVCVFIMLYVLVAVPVLVHFLTKAGA